MTCPLHEAIQKALADASITGGSVNGMAGIPLSGVVIAAGAMLSDTSPFPANGWADPSVKKLLNVKFTVQDQWARETLEEVITAAQEKGATAERLVDGLGGVRIRHGGSSAIFIPTAHVSNRVDVVVIDEAQQTLAVRTTEPDGSQHYYVETNIHPRAVGIVAVTALSQARDSIDHTIIATQLLHKLDRLNMNPRGFDDGELGMHAGDTEEQIADEIRDTILAVAQCAVGSREVETEDGRRVVRPSVDEFYMSSSVRRIGSTPPCPNGEDLEECLRQRRRRLALDYDEHGIPTLRAIHVPREAAARLPEDDAERQEVEVMDEEVRLAYEKYVSYLRSKNSSWAQKNDGVSALGELVLLGKLPAKEKAEVVDAIVEMTGDTEDTIRFVALVNLTKLVMADVLSDEECDKAMEAAFSVVEKFNPESEQDGAYSAAIDLLTATCGKLAVEDEKLNKAVQIAVDVLRNRKATPEAQRSAIFAFGYLADAHKLPAARQAEIKELLFDKIKSEDEFTHSDAALALAPLYVEGQLTDSEKMHFKAHLFSMANSKAVILQSTAMEIYEELTRRKQLSDDEINAIKDIAFGSVRADGYAKTPAMSFLLLLHLDGRLSSVEKAENVMQLLHTAMRKQYPSQDALDALSTLMERGELTKTEEEHLVGLLLERARDDGYGSSSSGAIATLAALYAEERLPSKADEREFARIVKDLTEELEDDLESDLVLRAANLLFGENKPQHVIRKEVGDLLAGVQTMAFPERLNGVPRYAAYVLKILLRSGLLNDRERQKALSLLRPVGKLTSESPSARIVIHSLTTR